MNNKKLILNKLFPCPPNNNYNNLMIDDETVSYITTPYNSDIIVGIIDSLIPKYILRNDIRILDGTACVGGDSISFGKIFGSVISSEINIKRYKMLMNNLNVFQLFNVIPINDDFINIIKRINYIDIVYLDPPWGGKNYKYKHNLRLHLSNIYIDDIVNMIFDKNTIKMIVLKLPKNYDFYNLYKLTKKPDITIIMYELQKMMIIVFTKY